MSEALLFEDEIHHSMFQVGSGTYYDFYGEIPEQAEQESTATLGLAHTRAVRAAFEPSIFPILGLAELDVEIINLPASKSPFDILILDEDKELKKGIFCLRKLVGVEYADILAQRVEYLIQVAYEDEPDCIPLVSASLNSFINLFISNPELLRPNIVLTPSRNLQAQWGKQRDKKFVVEFLQGNLVNFVLFTQDPVRKSKIARLSGQITKIIIMYFVIVHESI